MSKKLFWIILIPALLIIGGYIALQVFLRTGNKQEQNEPQATAQSTASQSGKAAMSTVPAAEPKEKKEEEQVAKKEENADSGGKEDSLSRENTSPLDLRPLFIEKMQDLVSKSSNGLYQLSVKDLEIDVLASTVSLHGVQLVPDKARQKILQAAGELPQSVITGSFDDLLIEGVNVNDAINSKTLDFALIRLINPVIEMEQYGTEGGGKGGSFSERFLQEMEKLAIGKLLVEGGSVTVKNKKDGSSKKLEKLDVQLEDILMTDATRKDESRVLFAKKAKLAFQNFFMQTSDGLYDLSIGETFVDATGKMVELKNLRFKSPLSKEEFVARQTEATEQYNISLPLVTVSGADWWSALNGEEISAGELALKGGQVSIFFDRSLPPKDRSGSFPNQLLHKMPLKLDVKNIDISDFDLEYEEKSNRTDQHSKIYFDNMSVQLKGVNNAKSNDQPVEVEASALFMKKVPMDARLLLHMKEADKGGFTAAFNFGGFDGALVNTFAKPLGLVTIEKGKVDSIKVQLQGDEAGARGNVLLKYDDLRIAMWKKRGGNSDELRKRPLMSFVANVFAIKNNNPWWLDGRLRRKYPTFEREPTDGFVTLIWRTMFVGILQTIGAPDSAAKKKK